MVARVARLMRDMRDENKKIVAVLGPAVVHTGAAPAFTRLVSQGWISVIFGGNAIAVDARRESEAFSPSHLPGHQFREGRGSVEGGHEHRLSDQPYPPVLAASASGGARSAPPFSSTRSSAKASPTCWLYP